MAFKILNCERSGTALPQSEPISKGGVGRGNGVPTPKELKGLALSLGVR